MRLTGINILTTTIKYTILLCGSKGTLTVLTPLISNPFFIALSKVYDSWRWITTRGQGRYWQVIRALHINRGMYPWFRKNSSSLKALKCPWREYTGTHYGTLGDTGPESGTQFNARDMFDELEEHWDIGSESWWMHGADVDVLIHCDMHKEMSVVSGPRNLRWHMLSS